MNKIGIIAPTTEFAQLVRRCFSGELERGSIVVEPLTIQLDQFAAQAQRMEAAGADAIIARGGNYEIIRDEVSIPVVQIPITAVDVIPALQKAARLGKKIVLVLRSTNCISLEKIRESLRYDFELFRYENDAEEGHITRYRALDPVIVGGRLACHYAERLGMDFCEIDTTVETIVDTVNHTKRLLKSTASEVERNRLYEAILGGMQNAVLSINGDGAIEVCNRQAELLLGIRRETALGCPLGEHSAEMARLCRSFLETDLPSQDCIAKGSGRALSVNLQRITTQGAPLVLCTFQDVTKVAAAEQKLRMQLYKKGLTAKTTFADIQYRDPVFSRMIRRAQAVAETDGAVLIVGESGTGKEMLAQSIHNGSARRGGPFVAVNCSAFSENLLESELFGYEEGAFTGARKGGKAGLFEAAHGGTFFLDEVNSLSLSMQVKLLRVLQEKEIMRMGSTQVTPVNIRIIAASGGGLYDSLRSGDFRRDLYFRLNTFELQIPPLRQRGEDVLLLFAAFVEELSHQRGKPARPLEADEAGDLLRYSWPGNIRELRSVAERYVLEPELAHIATILPSETWDASPLSGPEDESFLHPTETDGILDLKEITHTVEKTVIQMLLDGGYSKNEAAKLLGISRTSLWNKMS